MSGERTKYQTTLFPQKIATFPLASFSTCRYPETEADRRAPDINNWHTDAKHHGIVKL